MLNQNCHNHMVAEPLIARITAGNGLRSGDESFGAVVVATGVSTVGIWSEPCASCVCVFHACVLQTVKSSMIEQEVHDLAQRIAHMEEYGHSWAGDSRRSGGHQTAGETSNIQWCTRRLAAYARGSGPHMEGERKKAVE